MRKKILAIVFAAALAVGMVTPALAGHAVPAGATTGPGDQVTGTISQDCTNTTTTDIEVQLTLPEGQSASATVDCTP